MRKSFDTVEEYWDWRHIQAAYSVASCESVDRFSEEFARLFNVREADVHLMPSGRFALAWLLAARRDARRKVMVPAFNCSAVQSAIENAGYQPELYDFSVGPGWFDWQNIIDSLDDDVASLVVTHYYGVPVDLRPVLRACAARDIAVIEDCAHTLGGRIGDRYAGTFGDAAIFSFNYDKPISLGWGGLAIVNRPTAFDLNAPTTLRTPTTTQEIELLRTFYRVMGLRRQRIRNKRSRVKRVLRRVRLLKTERFLADPCVTVGAVQAELGRWCLANYNDISQKRNDNAKIIAKNYQGATWPVGDDIQPAWLKQKLKLVAQSDLKPVATRLQRIGYRVGNFNWPNLLAGCNQGHWEHSLSAATGWVDVPVHQNLECRDLDTMIRVLS